MVNISNETIEAYALENAVKYKGTANQGAVLAGLFAEGLDKSEIKEIIPTIAEILDKVNAMSVEDQLAAFEDVKEKISKREARVGLKDLPDAKYKDVVMRLAPFPSGPLHIGNARAAVLNNEYVNMYKGKFLLVMDDTIGSELKQIEPKAYKLIEEGITWLGIDYGKEPVYKSDRTEMYYGYAEELIKKGYMYVCNCSQEEFADLKVKGIECSCRAMDEDIHMERWKAMFKEKEGSMVVRLKTSMQDPDPAFRDRVMFKISEREHPRTKHKFRVYPSMEFSWAIDDHLLGVTHVLRGTEHYMSTRVQDFIRGIFGWENPVSVYNGHFAIEGIKISKSKGAAEVNSGKYTGWNDPRTWSLQSLRDRGIRPEAIKEFILNMGMKKSSVTTPVENLYTINKRYLDEVPRYFFVESPRRIRIKDAPELIAEIPLHPNGKLGFRKVNTKNEFLISRQDFEMLNNGNLRLMHLFNFKVDNVQTEESELSFISTEPDPKLKHKFLHWLPVSEDNVDVDVVMPDGEVVKGRGEKDLKKLKAGTVIQFERFGFVRLYKKHDDRLEFWFAHK